MPPVPATMQADDDAVHSNGGGSDHATGVILNNGPKEEGELDPESLANAEHLDNLEASEAVADIASFQDIALPPPAAPQNGDVTDVESNVGSGDPPESVRRAKKFYYCLPMVQMYRYHIMICLVLFAILLMAIGLAANSAQKANANPVYEKPVDAESGGQGPMKIDDAGADNSGDWYTYGNDEGEPGDLRDPDWDEYEGQEGEDWNGEDGDGDTGGDEELGDAHEAKAVTDPPTDAPREPPAGKDDAGEQTGDEDIMQEIEVDSPWETPSPAAAPGNGEGGWENCFGSGCDDAPSGPLGPRWYSTNRAKYQNLLSDPDADGQLSPHAAAGLFCQNEGLFLCSYEQYCPEGQGNAPFQDGPPGHLEWNSLTQIQWAPIYTPNVAMEGGTWVQIGKLPAENEGNEDNGFGKCWTYWEWDGGVGGDIEDVWGADHRQWFLCCEKDEDFDDPDDDRAGFGDGDR
ncbi:hypothetical protein ACHAXT_012817 [Thalassiosira profunda]